MNLALLLDNYWKRQKILPKVGKSMGTEFGTERRVTQVDLAPPMTSSIVMDVVVRRVLEKVCSLQEAQNGKGWAAGERKLVFFSNEGRI